MVRRDRPHLFWDITAVSKQDGAVLFQLSRAAARITPIHQIKREKNQSVGVKRIGGGRHYLDSLAQSEQATAY
jgi:hypothetical protein